MIRQRRFLLSTSVAAALAAAGCAKAPPPVAPPPLTIAAPEKAAVRAPMTLSAAADINPGVDGKPSPVVVRIYQLRSDKSFMSAEFFTLYDEDKKVLEQELISADEFLLAPGEKRTIDVSVAPGTAYVGAIAAFRDIRNAQWRGVVAAPSKGFTVSIERARVVLTPVK